MNSRMEEKKSKRKFITILVLSFLFHILVVGLFAYLSRLSPPQEQNIVYIDMNPKLAEELAKQEKKQIVETEDANKTPPKDAKYLSEHDQTVAEETKAKITAPFQKHQAQASQGKKFNLKQLAPDNMIPTPPTPEGMEPKQSQAEQKSQEQNNMAADSASMDYLDGVKESDRTLLNTKEFVFFSYFHRIRERLEQAWNDRLESAIRDHIYGGRSLASEKNYVTKLVITMDRQGVIRSIKVLAESGARDLDQAAVDAFNQAGPFPNPPAGLIDKDGFVKIPWDFIVKFG